MAASLSYNEARTALDLVVAELQARDLDVEAMAGLYERGQAYIHRCEALLEQVEQQITIWDEPAESGTDSSAAPSTDAERSI